jgi:indolepyruvate ferredoxin oxidoreductase beta subunit
MSDTQYSILIVGVGGQGVLLASELISHTAMRAGLDVKKSEVHGMSQRGGAVSSHVRMGSKVYSPTIEYGQADFLLAFEQAEGLRCLDWMKRDGLAIVSTTKLIPAIVTASKTFTYPDDAIDQMKKKTNNVIAVEADQMALELGNPRLVNTILLGVLSGHLPFPQEQWSETMQAKMKAKLVEINLRAFQRGREIQLTSARV